MNNLQLIAETVLCWKANTLSAKRAMEIIDLATSRDFDRTIPLEEMPKKDAYLLRLLTSKVDTHHAERYLPKGIGRRAYKLRQSGLPWADIAMKLKKDYWRTRRDAQSYALKEGKEWPIAIN